MSIFLVAVLVILTSIFFVLAVYSWPALIIIGPIPASRRVIRETLKMAGPKEGEVLYDLGSGDGRVLLEAVKTYNCRAVGYELFFPFFLFSRFKIWLSGKGDKITVRFQNFYNFDLSGADVIFCYLIPHGMAKLSKKFKREPLKKGTRVVSYSFPIKDWTPKRVLKLDRHTPNIYFYEV